MNALGAANVVEYRVQQKAPKHDVMFKLDYVYTKKHFKKIVKWC